MHSSFKIFWDLREAAILNRFRLPSDSMEFAAWTGIINDLNMKIAQLYDLETKNDR